jgi:small subunit ribosomal protein S21
MSSSIRSIERGVEGRNSPSIVMARLRGAWAFGLDGDSRPMSNPRFPTRTRTHHLEERCLETLLGRPLEVEVRDSVDKALKILKQKMSKEGILQEIKRRRYYEKPSVKRKRKMREARKRRRREAKRRVVR